MARIAFQPFSSRWGSHALGATVLGALLGVLGPFGSYLNQGALLRCAYWIGASWLGYSLYGAAVLASRRLTPHGSWRRWAALGLAVPIASLPEALATRSAALVIWPELHRYGPGWLGWYAQAVTIGTATALALTLLWDNQERRDRSAAPAGGPALVPMISQQPSFGDDVIALQMEDHYVRVHTAAGSTLVHMPLARAIEQVASIEGLRTHRSWWVARQALNGIEGTPRSMRLHLSSGLSVPVSRSSVATLRRSGWLTESI